MPGPTTPASSSSTLSIWTAEGKLGIRSQEKAQSANFKWENLDQDYHIQLFGPFGQGRVHIEKQGSTVELRKNNLQRQANSAQHLLQQETGIVMPVHWLSWWILGQSSPEQSVELATYNSEDKLSQFKQGDWLVTFLRFEQFNQHTLPTKITLEHEEYTLTIIIKSWSI